MTGAGLNKLKELATEVDELREEVENMKTRIYDFYTMEEDVLDRDAHMYLSFASGAMKDAVPCIIDALIGLQKAYDTEKKMMKFYNGLPEEQDNDEE